MNSGWLLFVLLVSLTLAVLAVALDTASRRGYGLGAFALVAVALALQGFGAFSQAAQGVAAGSLEVVAIGLVYVLGELCLALVLMLAAVVETVMARQWWWLGSIVIVSVVPAVVILSSSATLLSPALDALGLSRAASAVVLVLLSALVTCAYAVARSVRRPLTS